MKKLLLLINIVCICSFLDSCQNRHAKTVDNSVETKPTIKSDAVVSDTSKSHSQTSGSVSITGGSSAKKDTTVQHNNSNAIIHNSEDQRKLDSIKNAKKKIKNE